MRTIIIWLSTWSFSHYYKGKVSVIIVNGTQSMYKYYQRKISRTIFILLLSTRSTYKDYQHEVPRSIIILLSMQSISHFHKCEIRIKNINSNFNHNKTETTFNPSPIVFIFFPDILNVGYITPYNLFWRH